MIAVSSIVFCIGVLAFPLILISGFFIPLPTMSIILSSDALLIALANLVMQESIKRAPNNEGEK